MKHTENELNKNKKQQKRLENIGGSAILHGKVKRMEKEAERLKEEMKRKEVGTERLIERLTEKERLCRSQQEDVARLEVELSNYERREEKLQNRNEALLEQNEDLQVYFLRSLRVSGFFHFSVILCIQRVNFYDLIIREIYPLKPLIP